MTNINCTRDCKFQSDGKCCLESIIPAAYNAAQETGCPYQTVETKK